MNMVSFCSINTKISVYHKFRAMNYIYHEKQEGSLCGQHCLNNLLQDQYFSAVELAEIAQQMDQEETRRMAELGTNTSEFRQFLEVS
ncbi:hypothetical protein Anas_06969 [Armadillidium nasatum]|uniref:ubiquitinyl hydrolase 1 n=1 Tax=Armadillidium nasatum TaxID=96803 RepID=A0A5N5T5Y4_9CRUS|nr:hypothetical protein Anas_06969 [Armadillidium nasatum]